MYDFEIERPGSIADAVTAGLPTIALRHPSGVMAELAKIIGAPLAAPSANSSGRISPTEAFHVADDLGHKVDLILDDVLNLNVNDLLSRRLQTIVTKKLGFTTPYQARQAVVHGHIMIGERKVEKIA